MAAIPSIIRTMRAAILTAQREPLVIDTVELPDSLSYGQVLVKVAFSGICGSQLGEIDGVKGEDKFLPHLLGHEASGKVVAVGEGVKRVRPQDHVVMHWMKAPGIEAQPPAYRWQGKPLNAGWVTTFNEYAIVAENRVTAIPADFDPKIAALLGCAVTTGLGVINNKAKVKFGESVLVIGAGGVGLNVVEGARMASAHPIIAVDIYENKLELASEFGATHLLNANKIDIAAEVRKIAGAAGCDVVVDNTGMPKMIELAYSLTAARGRTILVGVPGKGNNSSIYTLPLHFGKTITGTHGGESDPAEDIPRYVRLQQAGITRLERLITATTPLAEINSAIQKMRTGAIAGRCVVEL